MGAHQNNTETTKTPAPASRLGARRRVVQVLSLLALHSSWGPEAKWLCMPVLSCHSCALAWFACPVGVFVHYAGWQMFPYFAIATVLLLGALLGRLFCGWICPVGFIQDMLHKIPSQKHPLPYWTSYIKYAVLALFVIAVPFALGENTWYSFCRVCPASAMQVTIPSIIREGLPDQVMPTAIRLSMLLFVLLVAVFSNRWFCKALCPIGAMLAPLNYVSLWKIPTPKENCLACRKCDKVCGMDGHPEKLALEQVEPNRQPECIYCYECRDECPLHGALAGPARRASVTTGGADRL